MTSVTFDTTIFKEAVGRAVGIAPSKGAAFDKAHGVVIEIMPDDKQASIRATDLETYYTTWIPIVSCEGDDTQWRLSANAFGGMIAKLKDGQQVTLNEKDNQLFVTSRMMKASFALGDMDSYPQWDIFEEDDLHDVSTMSLAINSVMWAAAGPSETMLNAVHLDGEYAMSTDRYKFARFPLKLPEAVAQGGITLPLSSAKTLSDIKGDIRFGFDGHSAMIMPDDDTQIKVIVLGGQYPSAVLESLAEVEYTHRVQIDHKDFVHMVDLASAINSNERVSKKLTFWIGRSQIAAMTTSETDRVRDIMEVPGQAAHQNRTEIRINPGYLSEALSNGDGLCTIHYSADTTYDRAGGSPLTKTLKFEKPGGYTAWVMPITG